MDHHTRHLPRLTALLLGLALAFTGQTASASDLTLYYPDAQGSPVAAADINGNILWRKHYEPYGKDANGVADDVGYTGHEHDAETGLTYMQARYQDPTSGRFYGIDPVGFDPNAPMTFNRYSYANNNPYKYIDPNGEAAVLGPVWTAALLEPSPAGEVVAVVVTVGVGGAMLADVIMNESAEAGDTGNAIDTDDEIDAILEDAKPATGKEGKKSGHFEKPGGSAEQDFDDLTGTEQPENANGTRVKELPDGSTANLHGSSGGEDTKKGTPTLEIQRPKGKRDIKIRYPERG